LFSNPNVQQWIKGISSKTRLRLPASDAVPGPKAEAPSIYRSGAKGRTAWPIRAMVAVWTLAIFAGMLALLHYSNSPGPDVTSPATWPVSSRISLDSNRPTLIMFAHPHCPCTRASLGELNRLVSNCQGKFNTQIWFIKPPGTDADWTNTVLWRQAAAISGVTVHCDDDGVETSRFHAETSGYTVLYDPRGNLLFQGGITMSRGHEGDNPGRSALESLAQRQPLSHVRTSVYGCSLLSIQCSQPETNSLQ
jgi:hypothetical protein